MLVTFRTPLVIILLSSLLACTSVPSRDEFTASYKLNTSSNDTVSVTITTEKVINGGAMSTMPIGATGTIVTSNGPVKAKWAYGHNDQMQVAEDLVKILKNNNTFKKIDLVTNNDTINSDYLINLRFHSTEHCCDRWYYIVDFSIEITDKNGAVVMKQREKFESNTASEVLNYSESFANALVPAKHKTKEKVLNISTQAIQKWLSKS